MNLLAETIFSKQHITSLCQIILQRSSAIPIQNQINQAAKLISQMCREERHQQNLANGGVLDAFATRIAAMVVSTGCVVPSAIVIAQKERILDDIPGPLPKNLDTAGLLAAVTAIISGSKLRASQLLYSPAILAVLPSVSAADLPVTNYSEAWAKFNVSPLSEKQSQLSAMDTLLPYFPRLTNRNAYASGAFPPLGTQRFQSPPSRSSVSKFTGTVSSGWQTTQGTAIPGIATPEGESNTEEPESPMVPWLFFLARSQKSLERVMAISVLTVLYRSGLTSKSRIPAFVLLIVPLLASLISDAAVQNKEIKELPAAALLKERTIKERVPAILATLITDNEALQKAAYEGGVIKHLAKMLKTAYEPVTDSKSRPWSPKLSTTFHATAIDESQSSKLGCRGLGPLLLHNIKVRESTLSAIAAMVPLKDEYRKALIDEGAVPFIVESMKTNPSKPTASAADKAENQREHTEDGPESTHGYGTNPISVLIAACHAVRALSRSVSILRTVLIDHGVAMPLVNLLQHADIDVQIAATAAVCNLVLDFSPMREVCSFKQNKSRKLTDLQTISEAGIVTILCKHAHSTNAKLKLNALWALKHLVLSTGNDVKKNCLRELGHGWLAQLITENTEDEVRVIRRGSSGDSDIAMDDDIDMDQPESELEDSAMRDSAHDGSDSHHNPENYRPSSSRSECLRLAQAHLAALREAERSPGKALKDDIAVQEQGLDFIRNLIGGVNQGGGADTVGAAEMVDFLFECLGQDRVFEILASKVRSKVINTPAGSRVQPPQPEIIVAVGYILVQMAASIPRHRQLITSQTELLKLLLPQFGHPNKEVRLALCHLVTNLTCVDDPNDAVDCRDRVKVLVAMGFLKKVEERGEGDEELDVRERAKHAAWQLKDDER